MHCAAQQHLDVSDNNGHWPVRPQEARRIPPHCHLKEHVGTLPPEVGTEIKMRALGALFVPCSRFLPVAPVNIQHSPGDQAGQYPSYGKYHACGSSARFLCLAEQERKRISQIRVIRSK